MPGTLHQHDGIWVYHRKDGALIFHGKRHSRHIPEMDRKYGRVKNKRKVKGDIPNPNYPHAGDGYIERQNPHNRPIKGGGRRKAGKLHKKGGKRRKK